VPREIFDDVDVREQGEGERNTSSVVLQTVDSPEKSQVSDSQVPLYAQASVI
jgi:hypothetical protein